MILAIPTSQVLTSAHVRKDAGQSLAAGQAVFLTAPVQGYKADLTPPHSAELHRDIKAGYAVGATLKLDNRVRDEWNLQGILAAPARDEWNVRGILIGGAAGTLVGLGAGIIQHLKEVNPAGGYALEAAFALIGCGLGSAVGSGLFQIEPTYDHTGEWGLKISANFPGH